MIPRALKTYGRDENNTKVLLCVGWKNYYYQNLPKAGLVLALSRILRAALIKFRVFV